MRPYIIANTTSIATFSAKQAFTQDTGTTETSFAPFCAENGNRKDEYHRITLITPNNNWVPGLFMLQ